MDDEFLTKVLLIGPWLVALVAVFVIGIPLFHAVSTMDTALFQTAQLAKTGASVTQLETAASSLVQSNLPTQMDSTVLFNPSSDISITVSATGAEETITVVYHVPVFAPFLSLAGRTGPTIPLHVTKLVSLASANNEGVNYVP